MKATMSLYLSCVMCEILIEWLRLELSFPFGSVFIHFKPYIPQLIKADAIRIFVSEVNGRILNQTRDHYELSLQKL